MKCQITLDLVSESLDGDIGDDWAYSVEAKVFNPGLTGAGTISVPEHTLKPGSSQGSPGRNLAVKIPAGACGTGPKVELTLNATEVDLILDDEGSNVIQVPMECPGPGGPPFTLEPEIVAKVLENPNFLGGAAKLTIKVRLTATCVK